MSPDELEFALSQYHDGTLPPLERAALDEVLASDAGARAMLAEYARLDSLLKRTPAAPELAWEKLSAHISSVVADAEAPAVRSFKIGTWSRAIGAGIALAAAIAIVASVALRNDSTNRPANGRGSIQVSIAPAGAISPQVGVTGDPVAVGPVNRPAVAEVGVGPSPQMATAGWQYDNAFLERPSRVVIAVSPEPAQDGGSPAPF